MDDDNRVYEIDPSFGQGDNIDLDDFNSDDNDDNDDNDNNDSNDSDSKGNNPNNNSFITVDNDNNDNDDTNTNTNTNGNSNNTTRGLRFKAADGSLHFLDETSYRLMQKVTVDAIIKAVEAVTTVKHNEIPDLYNKQTTAKINSTTANVSTKPKPVVYTKVSKKTSTINFDKMKIDKEIHQLQVGILRTACIRLGCVFYHRHKDAMKRRFSQWASTTKDIARVLRSYLAHWRDKTMRTILGRLTATRFIELIPDAIVLHWRKRTKLFAFNKWMRWLNYSGAMHTVKLLFSFWKLNAKESKESAHNKAIMIRRRYAKNLLSNITTNWKYMIRVKKVLRSVMNNDRINLRRCMNKLVYEWLCWKGINSSVNSSIHENSDNISVFLNETSISDSNSSASPFSKISNSPYSTPKAKSKAHHVSCTCVSCVKSKALAKSNSKRSPNTSSISRGPTPSTASRKTSSSLKKNTPTPTPKSKANISVTFEEDENIDKSTNQNISHSHNDSMVKKIKRPPVTASLAEKFMFRLKVANQLQERFERDRS